MWGWSSADTLQTRYRKLGAQTHVPVKLALLPAPELSPWGPSNCALNSEGTEKPSPFPVPREFRTPRGPLPAWAVSWGGRGQCHGGGDLRHEATRTSSWLCGEPGPLLVPHSPHGRGCPSPCPALPSPPLPGAPPSREPPSQARLWSGNFLSFQVLEKFFSSFWGRGTEGRPAGPAPPFHPFLL